MIPTGARYDTRPVRETGDLRSHHAPTLKDVAERAGVSRSAVSRTFTEGASVSDKMRRRVEKAAIELGYSPNALASSLTTGRTKLIGLVSNNFHNPIFLRSSTCSPVRFKTRGCAAAGQSDRRDRSRKFRADVAAILGGWRRRRLLDTATGFARAFRDAGMPVVHAFGRFTRAPQVHVVGIDNVESGRMAARTLVARGYRRIGFLGGPEVATSTQDRLKGFMAELAGHADIAVSHSFADTYSFDAGRREMLRLLKGPPAQAYFCGDDVLSIGALSAIEDNNLSVPGDIGIIGLNDMEMAGWQNINLTTIRQPVQQIVTSSIELMVAMLNDPDRCPEARSFACSIVERGTLRPIQA